MNTQSTAGKSSLMFTRDLPQNGRVIAEYVWIDGAGSMRSKCRTLEKKVTAVDEIPEWNFDGSSCYQATTENSEIVIKPVAYFPDPFRGGDNILVLTESFQWSDLAYKKLVPANTNFRHFAKQIFDATAGEEPWYGIEQEYTLLEGKNRFHIKPYGWPSSGYPGN